ncbi:MAG: hypothetical protein G01um101431_635 [Parcubacteria group bacterium Gr01-1014_31]|nr:MAG: hypothetical protein G01um101431_635 [Parcubacteria group bacterium Gr01-1014_31]
MATPPLLRNCRDSHAGLLLAAAAALWLAVVFVAAQWKYANLRYTAMDLGIFTQVVARSADGDWFGSTIHPPTYLGDHFSPALAVLTLPYRLVPSPLTLVFALQLSLALGAWPLYRLARTALPPLGALAVGLAYLLSPFTQNLALFEFHFIAFSVPVLLAAANTFARKKLPAFSGWCLAALLIREDVALVVLGFAVLALLQRRPWRWVLVPGVAAAAWLPAALVIIRAAGVSGSYKFFAYYAWLGDTPAAMLQTIFLRPWRWLAMLLRPPNVITAAGLLLPFAFLPLFSPAALALAALPALQMFLGAPGGGDLVLRTQYSALFLPGLWLAAILAIPRLPRSKLAAIVGRQGGLAIAVVTAAVVYGGLTLGPLPGTLRLMVRQGWQHESALARRALAAAMPQTGGVAAAYPLLPQVAGRTATVASLNYAFIGRQQLSTLSYALPADIDFVLLDVEEFLTYHLQYRTHVLYHGDYPTAAANLRAALATGNFGITQIAGSTVLLERNASSTLTLATVLPGTPADVHGTPQELDGGVRFLGYRAGPPAPGPMPPERQLPLVLYWSVNSVQPTPLYWQMLADGKPWGALQPLGNGVLPVTDWPQSAVVETSTWLWRPTASTLALQVVAVNSGGLFLALDLASELRVTKMTPVGEPIPLDDL